MTAPVRDRTPSPVPVVRSRRGLWPATTAIVLWLMVAIVIHLTQGTADVDAAVLWAVLTGSADLPQAAAILLESRVPRLLAAFVVGGALAASGAAMQAVSHNPLASPDTTAVGAGAYFALSMVTALGIGLAPLASLAVAFIGGLGAAAAVIGLAGRSLSPVRLVLAGSVLSLGLASLTSAVLLLFPWETQGLFAWGAGSLSQNGLTAITAVAPVLIVAAAGVLLMGRRLDLLQLGEEPAASLGVPVASTRRTVIALAVLLAAGSVTVAGPIGFVGLCAPAIVRGCGRWLPALRRQRVFIVLSAVAGVALVLSADVALRMLFGPVAGVTVPTGVLTSIIGAIVLIVLARRMPPAGGDAESIAGMRVGTGWGRSHPRTALAVAGALLLASAVAGVLLGDSVILLGDVWNWVRGAGAPRVEIILGTRLPRVLAALLAGAALALAGATVQAVTRNPLADPGVLGVAASAGFAAIAAITLSPVLSDTLIVACALVGAALAAGVLVVVGRGEQLRTVLVGIGIGAVSSAATTLLIIRTDPWNQTKAITWLGGSTYGSALLPLVPLLAILLIACVVLTRTSRDLDLLQLDDTTPRVLGIDVDRSRTVHVLLAVALTALATSSVGVISFVGLVGPHAARMIVGKRHSALLPVAAVIGGLLVVVGDILGRVVLAPEQLPAGLVVALIGTPYFLWLLHRMRADR